MLLNLLHLESCVFGCCFKQESYIVSGGTADWATTDGEPEYHDSVEACAKRCADLPKCKAFDYWNPGSYYGRRCSLWTAGKIHPQRSPGLPAYAGVCDKTKPSLPEGCFGPTGTVETREGVKTIPELRIGDEIRTSADNLDTTGFTEVCYILIECLMYP